MEHLKVRWIHTHVDEPVLLMSELNSDRYEVRKVEVYADGRMGFASADLREWWNHPGRKTHSTCDRDRIRSSVHRGRVRP